MLSSNKTFISGSAAASSSKKKESKKVPEAPASLKWNLMDQFNAVASPLKFQKKSPAAATPLIEAIPDSPEDRCLTTQDTDLASVLVEFVSTKKGCFYIHGTLAADFKINNGSKVEVSFVAGTNLDLKIDLERRMMKVWWSTGQDPRSPLKRDDAAIIQEVKACMKEWDIV